MVILFKKTKKKCFVTRLIRSDLTQYQSYCTLLTVYTSCRYTYEQMQKKNFFFLFERYSSIHAIDPTLHCHNMLNGKPRKRREALRMRVKYVSIWIYRSFDDVLSLAEHTLEPWWELQKKSDVPDSYKTFSGSYVHRELARTNKYY